MKEEKTSVFMTWNKQWYARAYVPIFSYENYGALCNIFLGRKRISGEFIAGGRENFENIFSRLFLSGDKAQESEFLNLGFQRTGELKKSGKRSNALPTIVIVFAPLWERSVNILTRLLPISMGL